MRAAARGACSHLLFATALALLLAACGSAPRLPKRGHAPTADRVPAVADAEVALPAAGSGRGAYYQDDGPGEAPPGGLRDVPDAEVRKEPYSTHSNRPYVVFGKTYTPMLNDLPFKQHGMASWYGKKFHGQRTSSGEIYDMYKMTAAHPTLPIPSYARLTSVRTGKQVIVRINDRGPFHPGRIIDVSYTAALRLGLLGAGSQEVELERVLPGETDRVAGAPRKDAPALETPALSLAEPPTPAPAPAGGLVPEPAPPEISALMLDDAAPGAAALSAAPSGPLPDAKTAPSRSFYLQLGAFSRADKAEAARARLADYSGVLGALEVVTAGAVHRLFSGPFPSRAEATQAAHSLPAGVSVKPVVVQR